MGERAQPMTDLAFWALMVGLVGLVCVVAMALFPDP
jgi:hypothetical protein